MKLMPDTPTEAMLQAMKEAHMPFGCMEAAYHAAWLEAPKASAVYNRAIATMVGKLHLAESAPDDVLEEAHNQAVRLMYDLASHLQPLLQDCLDFALDVPECGCAHSRACSSCERYREAQRLAEKLVEVMQ